ncbi:MAG TPA: lysophospholipid acyltransferase family protein [bacterium]|nr:lysophospholipid acyltransferase family protein [bacterium]HPP29677.1 lysophospholipid acyltransferase family protein [bacterium]
MKKKKKRKDDKLTHFFIFQFFVVFFYTVKFIPSVLYPFLSRIAGLIAFYTMGASRKLILKNMDIAYGDTVDREKKKDIARKLFTGIVLSLCECIQIAKLKDEQLLDMVVFEGEENLKDALGQNRGVVGISPHMGNFPRLQAVLAKKGYPATYFSRPPSGKHLAKLFRKLIASENVPLIYVTNRRQAIIDAHRWVQNKGMLCFYIDQHDSKGVEVEFFGKKVFAPAGAAAFARKYDCPVLGLFTYRMRNGRQKIIIEGPYQLQKTDNAEEDIRVNTAFFLKRIEYYVRLYPEHWYSWLHKRFPGLY